jgi:hypothetical protein
MHGVVVGMCAGQMTEQMCSNTRISLQFVLVQFTRRPLHYMFMHSILHCEHATHLLSITGNDLLEEGGAEAALLRFERMNSRRELIMVSCQKKSTSLEDGNECLRLGRLSRLVDHNKFEIVLVLEIAIPRTDACRQHYGTLSN